jgi:hypothetical protein
MATATIHIPEDIVEALEEGEISQSQLRWLFEIEAAALGLSLEEAVIAARNDTLPRDWIGLDLRLLVLMLADDEVDDSE